MVVHRNWASGKTSTAVTVNTAVPLVRSMCKMECNNVLDANVMVNTCSGTTTKGTECQICLLLNKHHSVEQRRRIKLTNPFMAGNAKPCRMMGKYGRVGSLMLYGSGVGGWQGLANGREKKSG